MRASEAQQVLMAAFAAWPGFQVTPEMGKLWAETFPGIDRDTFWEVMKAALKIHTGNYPPTIGQVHAVLRTRDEMANGEVNEGDAWELVMTAIRRFGHSQPGRALEWLHSRDPYVAEAAHQMGWRDMCTMEVRDAAINRAHFWKIVTAHRDRAAKAKMMGLPEPTPAYLRLGVQDPNPINPREAKTVLARIAKALEERKQLPGAK